MGEPAAQHPGRERAGPRLGLLRAMAQEADILAVQPGEQGHAAIAQFAIGQGKMLCCCVDIAALEQGAEHGEGHAEMDQHPQQRREEVLERGGDCRGRA